MAGRTRNPRKFDAQPIRRNKARVLGREGSGRFIHSLTPEVLDLIVRHVATGAAVDTAAAAVGVTGPTLRKWLIRGRDALMADEIPESEAIFAELVHKVNGILARFEIEALERIGRHADYDWRAEAWLLEKKFPESYGKRSLLEIGNKPGESFRVDAGGLDANAIEQLRELREALAKVRGALPAGSNEDVIEGEFEEIPAAAA